MPGTVSSSCDVNVNDGDQGMIRLQNCVTDGVDGLRENALGLVPNLLAEDLTDCMRRVRMDWVKVDTW